MADQSNADVDASFIAETNTRDDRELVEMWDKLSDLREEVLGTNRIDNIYEVEVTSEHLSEEECEELQTALLNTIGNYRGIVGNDKYISSGVYWDLVSEYAEEVIESLEEDPEWADSDLAIFREVVMPTQMARHYPADPVANFSALYNSRHSAEGWAEEMANQYYGVESMDGFIEYIEEKDWKGVLGSMAYAACLKDVAQKVRDEGHDLDLEHFEYQR